ncbi:helix-turn-helix transcriptional regulator [Lacticaseibacillus pantheris]|uniref:helix-turn-helix transcriptional regulator n=1 Tax=Lacticaseibacillus pantheris TaxID=171523 RepID=UPI0026591C66|nr:helix-turn-helix transcriptional regulator [Lacticaseibacillus pantheris]WKF85277.1 helix-turn-helix transcriptional regulator [Lacticaseibacillus pantheris]
MNINEQLQYARNQRQLTQQTVADSLHVSRQTISNWETGRSLPDIDACMLLSDFYGVSLDELLRSGDMLNQLHAQEKVQIQARRVYQLNLVLDAVLIISWFSQRLRHGRGLSGTALLIVLLIVNLTTLKDARQHNWQVNRRHFSLTVKLGRIIAGTAGTIAAIIEMLIHPVTFYGVGYAIGTGLIIGLFIWGLLPTRVAISS